MTDKVKSSGGKAVRGMAMDGLQNAARLNPRLIQEGLHTGASLNPRAIKPPQKQTETSPPAKK